MICPFYGMHDRGLGVGVVGVLRPSHGNQCALVRPGFSGCEMEMRGLPVEWAECLYGFGASVEWEERLYGFGALPDCIHRCVGCNRHWHVCPDPLHCDAVAKGLCPTCLHRAERLALEAAGQGRLLP